MIKQLSSMSFNILLLIICCVFFAILQYLPEHFQGLMKTTLLSILALSLSFCILNRWRALLKIRKIRKLADLLLHLGVVIIIVAGFMCTFKHVSYIEINEYQALDLTTRGFPISISADSIQVLKYPNGDIKQYVTSVSIWEGNQIIKQAKVSVNNPVKYHGIKIYQSTFKSSNGVKTSGLTIKTEPGLPLVMLGLALVASGSTLMLFRGIKGDAPGE